MQWLTFANLLEGINQQENTERIMSQRIHSKQNIALDALKRQMQKETKLAHF